MTTLISHPLRSALHDELHQRPGMPVQTPACASSVTFFGASSSEQRAFLNHLLRVIGHSPVDDHVMHWQHSFADYELRWSLHTEFSRLTVLQNKNAGDFSQTALQCLPQTVWQNLPGQVISALHALIVPADQVPSQITEVSQRWFGGNTVVGAKVANGKLVFISDLKRHLDSQIEAGATRLCVINQGAGKHLTGRALHDFFEMESYRLMGLLSFPLAKQLLPVVSQLETRLQDITRRIADGEEPEMTQHKLNTVTEMLDDAIASSHVRFSATRAYAAMMERRLKNLHEESFDGFSSFTEVMERRIAPAFATVESVRNRLQELSNHLQRTSGLLRTRIELNLLKQNQGLLTALNRRADMQLRLQQMVEGLSVVVIGYYSVSLLHYVLDGLSHAGVAIDVSLGTALSVPLILTVLFWRLKGLSKKISEPLSTASDNSP